MKHASLASLFLLLFAAIATAGVSVQPLEGGARYKVTFRHQPVIAVKRVHLAGSFNGWRPDKDRMRDADGDGTFEVTLVLERGEHHYKFVVEGETWLHDQDNPRTTADGHSGFNSVLALGSDTPQQPGKVGDGAIAMNQLVHDPADLAHASAVDGRRRLVLRLHALRGDVEDVFVEVSPRPVEAKDGRVRARRIATWEGRDVYEARVSFSRPPSKVRYAWSLEDGGQVARLPSGRQRFGLSTKVAGRFHTPDWVRDAVFYQIFPDRFRDGDPERQPALPPRPEGTPWHVDDRYLDAWGARPSHFNFMGGDLAGITERLDYLSDLGVTALYLNPIFAAGSNHRYDASDYERVDPALGTEADFSELKSAAEERGMRLLLDAVFNHTGDTHYAFRDAMEKGTKSKYWKWFFFEGFPVLQSPKPNYRCWWGFGSLPQLDTNNPQVIDHLMGVGKKWLKDGAAGWRLDVPNEVEAVNPDFWPEFRKQVRGVDPDAYIVGEIWTDARHWLSGDRFDATMNYPLRSAVLEFMVKGSIDGRAFAEGLGQQLATLPEAALRVQFNLLGSHDTARILTLAGGDARKVRQALTFLFAWQGAPVVYYGDEVGLDGGKDPECRKAFPWDPSQQDTTTLEHTRSLGKLRQAERALRRGTTRFLSTDGRTCAFVREPETGEPGRPVLCVFNSGGARTTVRVPLDGLSGEPTPLLGGDGVTRRGGVLEVELGPHESALVALGAGQ